MNPYSTSFDNHPLKKATMKSLYDSTLVEIPITKEESVWKVLVFMFLFFSGVFAFMVYQTWRLVVDLPLGVTLPKLGQGNNRIVLV